MLKRIAWRPFWTYRQEESGTKIHLIDTDKSQKKVLCGKEHNLVDSEYGSSPATSGYCKRCAKIARNNGATNQEILQMPWFKSRES